MMMVKNYNADYHFFLRLFIYMIILDIFLTYIGTKYFSISELNPLVKSVSSFVWLMMKLATLSVLAAIDLLMDYTNDDIQDITDQFFMFAFIISVIFNIISLYSIVIHLFGV